jgi:hypothetical protein
MGKHAGVYNLDVDLEYPSIPPPHENDVLLSTISVSSGLRGAALESFRRCRVASHALYLSCLASANGRALDPTRGQPGADYSTSTTYDFPKERPSAEDWATWRQFWQQYCLPDGSLPRSLGKWRHPTHRVWEWFYDKPSDVVYQREGEGYRLHQPGTGSPGALTRAKQVYSPSEDIVAALPELCLPASVSPDGSGSVTLLPCGPALYDAADSTTSAAEDFWTFLRDPGEATGCGIIANFLSAFNRLWIASRLARPSMSRMAPTTDSRGRT